MATSGQNVLGKDLAFSWKLNRRQPSTDVEIIDKEHMDDLPIKLKPKVPSVISSQARVLKIIDDKLDSDEERLWLVEWDDGTTSWEPKNHFYDTDDDRIVNECWISYEKNKQRKSRLKASERSPSAGSNHNTNAPNKRQRRQ